MKRLSIEQYLREEKKILDRKSPEWVAAWNQLRGDQPAYLQENIVADSSMTIEQINTRQREFIDLAVPFQWSHIVCKCTHPKYDNQALTCRECGKIARWRLQQCGSCREKYIKGDFKHPMRKDGQRLDGDESPLTITCCYDCIAEHYGEGEPPKNTPRETPTLSEASFESFDFGDFNF